MSVRRLNYTGRKRIAQHDVAIELDRTHEPPQFIATVDLPSYGFPANAEVVLEASVDWTVMRFEFGTIGTPARDMHGALTDFEGVEGLRFALKVLGADDEAGLILGEASGVTPQDAEIERSGRSFVAVRPTDLGHVAWQLSFDEVHPVLLVNEVVGDWKGFVRNDSFRTLVAPEIFRRLLEHACEEDIDTESDGTSRKWEAECLKTAAMLGGLELPPPRDEERLEQWIISAVAAFAKTHRLGALLKNETWNSDIG